MKGLFAVLAVVSLILLSSAGSPRRIKCDGTQKKADPYLTQIYNLFFGEFQETPERSGQDALNTEALIALGVARHGGGDIGEMLITLKRISLKIASSNVTIREISSVWFETWNDLAYNTSEDAKMFYQSYNFESAFYAFRRAAMYWQLAERLTNHIDKRSVEAYRKSIQNFQASFAVPHALGPKMEYLRIPYRDANGYHYLHGYMTFSQQMKKKGTIVAMTGYDGSAELTVFEVALKAAEQGYDTISFDGPGQGAMPRLHNLYFRYDWEVVITQVTDFLLDRGQPTGPIILWGRSLGGYLAPRGFAGEPRITACVADGGVDDFGQLLMCHFPKSLRDLFYDNPVKFDAMLTEYRKYSVSLNFMLDYGYLAFNVSTPTELFTATLEMHMSTSQYRRMANRPILLNDPVLDTMAGNQSQIMWSKLVDVSPDSQVLELDPLRGTALHCGIGSTANEEEEILKWISKIVKLQEAT